HVAVKAAKGVPLLAEGVDRGRLRVADVLERQPGYAVRDGVLAPLGAHEPAADDFLAFALFVLECQGGARLRAAQVVERPGFHARFVRRCELAAGRWTKVSIWGAESRVRGARPAAGDASNVSARAGYAAAGAGFELPGSAVTGEFLDGGPDALAFNSFG